MMSAPETIPMSSPRAAAASHCPRFFLAFVIVRVFMETIYSLQIVLSSSLPAELPVAGVAHAGDDVTAVIQVGIGRAEVDFDVAVGFGKFADALGRGEQAEVFDLL